MKMSSKNREDDGSKSNLLYLGRFIHMVHVINDIRNIYNMYILNIIILKYLYIYMLFPIL
jgi:hypothetical protein